MKKKCTKCKQDKELEKFNISHSNKDKRENKCIGCQKEHYENAKPSKEYRENYFVHDKYYS